MKPSGERVPLGAAASWAALVALLVGVLFTVNAYMLVDHEASPGEVLTVYFHQVLPWLMWAALVPIIFGLLNLVRVGARPLPSVVAIHLAVGVASVLLHVFAVGIVAWSVGLFWPGLSLKAVLTRLLSLRVGTDWINYALGASAYHIVVYVRRLQASQERIRVLGRQRLEGLRALAGGVAHELNNCLTGILGLVDLLEDGRESQARADDFGELRRLLDDCIGLGRDLQALGEGVFMQPRLTTIGDLLTALPRTLAPFGERLKIEDVQPPVSTVVRVDPERLGQAILSVALHLSENGIPPEMTRICVEWSDDDDRTTDAEGGSSTSESTVAIVIRNLAPRPAATAEGSWLVESDGRVTLDLTLAAAHGLMRQMGGSLKTEWSSGKMALHLPGTSAGTEAYA